MKRISYSHNIFRQVQLLKAIRNVHTPDSIFVVTDVPFVLIVIGVESH